MKSAPTCCLHCLMVVALATLFPCFQVFAQSIPDYVLAVEIKAIYYDNNVLLRWAPANYKTWEWGRDSGYVLTRMTLSNASGPLSPADQVSTIITVPLSPHPQVEWEPLINTDSLVGVAAGAYYGSSFIVSGPVNEGIVTARNINTERENRYGLSLFAADNSTLAAGMLNLAYSDTDVGPNSEYTYSVRPGGNPNIQGYRAARIQVSTANSFVFPPVDSLIGFPGDSLANLSWHHFATAEHYSSYNIWRSKSGGPYIKVNSEPVLPTDLASGQVTKRLLYLDQLENNVNIYQFKVSGHSPFGVESPFSNIVSIKGEPTPLRASIGIWSAKEIQNGFVEVNWDFPFSLNNEILGFSIWRDDSLDGNYSRISSGLLGSASRQFVDISPLLESYYKVQFIDLNGNKVESPPVLVQLKDSIPPLPPGLITGEAIGSEGVLRIHWVPSTSSDVMGYRVFMSDQSDGNYGQVTAHWVKDTVFTYQANTKSLTEEKYFRVKAVDFRENSSIYNKPGVIRLPDMVPPSPPILKRAEPQGEDVLIEWTPSSSKDVEQHRILRKKKDEVKWDTLFSTDIITGNSMIYLDTSAQVMYSYDYMVEAIDEAEKASNSKVFPVKGLGKGIRPGVTNLKVNFVKSDDRIHMEWDYTNAYGVETFIVYRGFEAGKLYEIASITPQQVLVGGEYNGPDPFVPKGQSLTTAGVAFVEGDKAINMQQEGSPITVHGTSFEYEDKEFLKFKKYYYSIAVKFSDGTGSAPGAVKSTSTY